MRYKINAEVKKAGIEELVKDKINFMEDSFNSRLKELAGLKSGKLIPIDITPQELYGYARELNNHFDQEYSDLRDLWEKEIDFKKYDVVVEEISKNYLNELKKYKPKKDKIK